MRPLVRVYAQPETRKKPRPESRLVVADGSTLLQVRLSLDEVDQLLADLVGVKGTLKQWADERETRLRVRRARRDGITLPIETEQAADQPMMADDGTLHAAVLTG